MSEGGRRLDPEVATHRDPDHGVAPLPVERWSSRAMTGEPLDESAYRPLFEAAREAPAVPETFELEAMVAVGERGDPGSLPEPLRERAVPSGRKPVEEITIRGRFPAD
jgi:hypothetical protein